MCQWYKGQKLFVASFLPSCPLHTVAQLSRGKLPTAHEEMEINQKFTMEQYALVLSLHLRLSFNQSVIRDHLGAVTRDR